MSARGLHGVVASARLAVCAITAVALSLGGCLDETLVPLRTTGQDAGPLPTTGQDAGPRFRSWGAYAALLPVPPCRGALALEVDTTSSELDGGSELDDPANAGPSLSFVEALQIGANRDERVVIRFAAERFPEDQPATIALTGDCTLPRLEDVCVDARSRGVIIDFRGAESSACTLNLGADALVVGLELRRLRWQVTVDAGQLAGCRLNSDGMQATTASESETVVAEGRAMIGPGNSFGNTSGVVIKSATPEVMTIFGNHFGVDPVTGSLIFNQHGVRVSALGTRGSGMLHVQENVFRSQTGVRVESAAMDFQISLNVFERGEGEATSGWTGVATDRSPLAEEHFAQIGPANQFLGLDTAIRVASGVTISNNVITDCGAAIVSSTPTVAPPEITTARTTVVAGRCAGPGLVEIFTTDDDQADAFVGSAACGLDGAWRIERAIAGPNVTATLTTSAGTSELSAPVAVSP